MYLYFIIVSYGLLTWLYNHVFNDEWKLFPLLNSISKSLFTYKRVIIFDNIILFSIIMLLYCDCISLYLKTLLISMIELSSGSDFSISINSNENIYLPYV